MYQGDLLKLIFVEVAYTQRVHELRVDLLGLTDFVNKNKPCSGQANRRKRGQGSRAGNLTLVGRP